MPCGAHGTANSSMMPWRRASSRSWPSTLGELQRVGKDGRHERHHVDAVDRILVLVDRRAGSRTICACPVCTARFDLGRLEQRRPGMHGDLQLAAGRGSRPWQTGKIFRVRIVGRKAAGRFHLVVAFAAPPANARPAASALRSQKPITHGCITLWLEASPKRHPRRTITISGNTVMMATPRPEEEEWQRGARHRIGCLFRSWSEVRTG